MSIGDRRLRHVSTDGFVTDVGFALPEEVETGGGFEDVCASSYQSRAVRMSVRHVDYHDWERIVRDLCEACTLGDPAAWRRAWSALEDLTLRRLARSVSLKDRVRALTDSTTLGPDEAAAVAVLAAMEEPGWSLGACRIALCQAHAVVADGCPFAQKFSTRKPVKDRRGALEVLDLLLARCDLTRDDVLMMSTCGLLRHFESSESDTRHIFDPEWPIGTSSFMNNRMHRKISERFGISMGDFKPVKTSNHIPFPLGRAYIVTDKMHPNYEEARLLASRVKTM
jgi:hypothetical protein